MKNRNQLFAILVALVLLAGMLASCAPKASTPAVTEIPAEAAYPVAAALTITDGLDRTVSFEKMPERIVVAGKATALMVNTLYAFPEAATRIVAIENRSQSPDKFISLLDPALTGKLTIEKNAGPEAIAPTRPDVVILKSSMKEKLGDPLEQLGIKVVYVDLETPDQFYRDVRVLGALLDNTARAEEIVSYYEGRVSMVTDALKDLTPEEKHPILLLQHSIEDNVIAFSVPPAAWMQTILTEMAGGTPVWKDSATGSGWEVVTLDQIAAWNPFGIAIVDYGGGASEAVAAIKADPTWQSLEAVKSNHIYAFPMDYLSWDQPDPRWILGFTWIATSLHADKFPGFDITTEVISFYKTMYGLDEAAIRVEILPLITGDLTVATH
ncbi:MAG: ABC transporter substrate-binding protein [Anaerolineaceae bacterium]